MRKTLTLLTLIAAATSLAACKMPWESEPKPAAATPLAAETVNTAQRSTDLPTPATAGQTTGPAVAAATPSSTPATK